MKTLLKLSLSIGLFLAGLGTGFLLFSQKSNFIKQIFQTQFNSPFVKQKIFKKELPLNVYSIKNLKNYHYQTSPIKLEILLDEEKIYTSYLFSYQTVSKKMSGVVNIPNKSAPKTGFPAIVMLRGWVPLEIYKPGIGTKNAAAVFANNGYITFAPDFFGYGNSDKDFENSWEGRFVKTINVIELIKSIKEKNLILAENLKKSVNLTQTQLPKINQNKIGIWAHSNGGQIALTTLEILSEPIPTTLWAPVTTPFPYSILFFTDEMDDEGKETRAWLNIFEQDYDVFEFTLTKHLNFLTGPLQIHHGTADEAALIAWSNEFIEKLEVENKRRKEIKKAQAVSQKNNNLTTSDNDLAQTPVLEPVEFQYFKYNGANHNLKTVWGTVIQRDVSWFEKWLK